MKRGNGPDPTFSPPHEGKLTLLAVEGVSNCFGSLWANRDVSMDVRQGEIHAIVGENGAGKSTLLKILFGHLRPNAGRVLLDGKPVHFRSPGDAMGAGLGLVHQNLQIFPRLTVLENVILGVEPARFGFLDRGDAREKIQDLCKTFGFDLPLDAAAGEIPFVGRQQIEILRSLYRGARLLLLDEPTSLLSPAEVRKFLQFLATLKLRGCSIVLVSHRLEEVMGLADRVSVMRQGSCLGTFLPGEVTVEQLAELIVSGSSAGVACTPSGPGEVCTGQGPVNGVTLPVVFRMVRVGGGGSEHEPGLDALTMDVHQGEILGLGGIVGNGERTLARMISGLIPCREGKIFFSGRDVSLRSIADRREMGLRWLPANPLEEALLPLRSLWENILLGHQHALTSGSRGFLKWKEIRDWSLACLALGDVVHGGVWENLDSLSGGNQQKLALTRVLAGSPRMVLLEQPGRGVDIHARRRLWDRLEGMSVQGVSFVILSQDVDELLTRCHRVGVLFRGRLAGMAPVQEVSPELLGRWMLGLN